MFHPVTRYAKISRQLIIQLIFPDRIHRLGSIVLSQVGEKGDEFRAGCRGQIICSSNSIGKVKLHWADNYYIEEKSTIAGRS